MKDQHSIRGKAPQKGTSDFSRRDFLYSSAVGAASAAMLNPALAAAQSVGVKPGDLPDLTIKEVKVYVTDMTNIHRLNGTETGELVSVVTHSGIEGNYTIGNRNHTTGWLDWAKSALVGKNVTDLLPTLAATSGMKGPGGFDASSFGRPGAGGRTPPGFGTEPQRPGEGPAFGGAAVAGSALQTHGAGSWPNYYIAAADVCLWDILGKAVNRPIYKILQGGVNNRDRVMAYASSNHLPAIEDYVPDALKAKELGYKGYKIHPGRGQHRTGPEIPTYVGHIEIIREIRKAVGDEFVLMHDPVQMYNRFEALTVGRLLDELDYLWFEDPIRTIDEEGLIELERKLHLPMHVGEFLYSIADYAEYIKRDALGAVRLISDNVGGISGSMRVALLADAHGLECAPHNWGNEYDMMVAFHLELALPNAYWFEVPHPVEYTDRPYLKNKFRIDQDSYVLAPTEPGLGLPIDRAALDKITKQILR
jgi:L-alanine-DL-glutamate epimerase-like enolase superfamily enzyme